MTADSRFLDADACHAAASLFSPGVGQAGSMLCDLTGTQIELSLFFSQLSSLRARAGGLFPEGHRPETIIAQEFEGQWSGRIVLGFSAAGGITLAQLLSGRAADDQSELDSELCEILLEAGNIVLNGVMSSLAAALDTEFRYSLPELQTACRKGEQFLADIVGEDDVLIGSIPIRVGPQEIDGITIAVCPVQGVRLLLNQLLETTAATAEPRQFSSTGHHFTERL